MSALPAFVVLTRQKSPVPERRHAATSGSIESLPRYGIDRERVDERLPRPRALEVRVRVGARGRADVAALPVRDDEQACCSRVRADLLEGADPVRAERFEERELELHSDYVRGDRVDESAAETRARISGRAAAPVRFTAKLDGQELGARIEADEQLAALLVDCGREAVGEGETAVSRPASTFCAMH